MFTGIIESTGIVKSIEENIFSIEHKFKTPFKIGDSIALSGMCTTVIKIDDNIFTVEIMAESRNCTIFGDIKVGQKINLERPVRMGDRNSGHFVLGHVDEVGRIVQRTREADFELFRIQISSENRKFIVHKGSVAVDGISLTVSKVGDDWFEVSIISHTLKETTLGLKKVGEGVNIEFDILGKYVVGEK